MLTQAPHSIASSQQCGQRAGDPGVAILLLPGIWHARCGSAVQDSHACLYPGCLQLLGCVCVSLRWPPRARSALHRAQGPLGEPTLPKSHFMHLAGPLSARGFALPGPLLWASSSLPTGWQYSCPSAPGCLGEAVERRHPWAPVGCAPSPANRVTLGTVLNLSFVCWEGEHVWQTD